jgi:hypothetical protein
VWEGGGCKAPPYPDWADKMIMKPYGVHVIVDPHFGERLHATPTGEPVWIVDSDINHDVISAVWHENSQKNHTIGITSFSFNPNAKPDDWLISQLDAIDTHFGELSHDPPYSFMNIIGVSWSEKIQKELNRFGFIRHEDTAGGFLTRRELPNQALDPSAG